MKTNRRGFLGALAALPFLGKIAGKVPVEAIAKAPELTVPVAALTDPHVMTGSWMLCSTIILPSRSVIPPPRSSSPRNRKGWNKGPQGGPV